jgi:xylan 1,4-beta-xylosidase
MLERGVRDRPDVSALASLDGNRLCVLVWHYHDDDLPGPDARVTLAIDGLTAPDGEVPVEHFRIDARHSNAYTVWQGMGSPQQPTAEQHARLERAGQLERLDGPRTVRIDGGRADVRLTLPRQAVLLLVIRVTP